MALQAPVKSEQRELSVRDMMAARESRCDAEPPEHRSDTDHPRIKRSVRLNTCVPFQVMLPVVMVSEFAASLKVIVWVPAVFRMMPE